MLHATSIGAVTAIVAAAILIATTGGLAGASTGGDGSRAATTATRKVTVADDFYAPKRLRVRSGTRVKWVWSSDSSGYHDLYVHERPDGAARFRVRPSRAPFRFTRKLRKAGVYKILCTVHEGMRMRITVTRRASG